MFLGSNLSKVCTKEMIQAEGNGTCEIIQSKAHTEQRRRQTEITLNPDSKNVVAGSKETSTVDARSAESRDQGKQQQQARRQRHIKRFITSPQLGRPLGQQT